ncbi:MAG: hypothetical protein HKN68_09305 [Saprospiraceae bacterium]|nr:hypothetical protein [Saprospiraceae bacterium]
MIRIITILTFMITCFTQVEPLGVKDGRIRGITMVAPPRAFNDDPMVPIKNVNADWIAVVPYAYSRKANPEVRFNSKRQWWGERTEGIKESIKAAHNKGLKVMIKPQVYVPGSWVGDVDYESEVDWRIWEDSYRRYLMTYVDIAIEVGAEMLCIGTEYKIAVQKRETFWRQLIQDIRSKYSGLLIYSSNWDGFKNVPFWDDLDFIGISAYFPLLKDKTPSVKKLRRRWRPIVSKLKKYSKKQGKRIVFTEYGYLTVDGCAYKSWELEKQVNQLSINQQAQANAYDALLTTFWNQDFWAGGFLWKWFPNGMGHEGYPEKDYTPQGKIAEEIIKGWYGN